MSELVPANPPPESGDLCPVLVGRTRELSVLEGALEQGRCRHFNAVLITGEAGIGKTRLAREARCRARELGFETLVGGCSEAELRLPYLPFLEALGDYLGSDPGVAVAERLGPHRLALAVLFPALGRPSTPGPPARPGQFDALHLFEAVATLVRLAAESAGLVLVLEDLHWADRSTRQLLAYLARRLLGAPVVLVLTCRSEEVPADGPLRRTISDLARRCPLAQVDLGPLGRAEVREMVHEALSLHTRADVTRLLLDRSGGNPFLLEELLRAAVERAQGQPFAASVLARTPLPDTVREAVLLRVGRLDPRARGLLAAASVLGASFRDATLRAMLRMDAEKVDRHLGECVQRRLLEVEPTAAGRYRFRHDLVREAVYRGLPVAQGRRLHARAADALVRRSDAPAIEVAHHLLAAGRLGDALPLCVQAGDAAAHAHAFDEAAQLYELVLARLDEGLRGRTPERAHLLGKLGSARAANGDPVAAAASLEEAVQLLETAADPRSAARYRITLGFCRAQCGRPDLAVTEYRVARAALEREGPSAELAEACRRLAIDHVTRLEAVDAVAMGRRVLDVAEGAGEEDKRLSGWVAIGIGKALGGEVDEGLEHLENSHGEAVSQGFNLIAAAALYYAAWTSLLAGRANAALSRTRRLHAANAGGWYRHAAHMIEGLVYLWGLGEPARALDAIERALRPVDMEPVPYLVASAQVHIAVARGQLGQTQLARQLLDAQSEHLQPAELFYRHWAGVRLSLDEGDVDAALRAARLAASSRTGSAMVSDFLDDVVVEALIAAGEVSEAWLLIRDRAPADNPFAGRARGRVHLGRNELVAAHRDVACAVNYWQLEGCRLEESRGRMLLAEVLRRKGDIAGAAVEFRRVLSSALRRGVALDAQRARNGLEQLGVRTSATAADVRAALQDLDRPERLGRSPLVNLRCLHGEKDPAAALGRRLTGVVEELAASPAHRAALAGQLLRAYYVERVGSQELVAERLNLPRSTFYRRLHAAWEVAAERLGEFELPSEA